MQTAFMGFFPCEDVCDMCEYIQRVYFAMKVVYLISAISYYKYKEKDRLWVIYIFFY